MKKAAVFLASIIACFTSIVLSCSNNTTDLSPPVQSKLDIQQEVFGRTTDGEIVDLYTLTNSSDLRVRIMSYGGIIVSLEVPDREGNLTDIVLGFDSLDGYLRGHPYFGALVGRFANRIVNGRFTLDGREYKLPINNGPHHLHGGIKGFDKHVWRASPIKEPLAVGCAMTYYSRDGEEGYPGNLTCTAEYRLTNENELRIDYFAVTDKPTLISLTNHSYFNLAGHGVGDMLNHEVTFMADAFLERREEDNTPTGVIIPVKGTPLDFKTPRRIGERIDKVGAGYGHCLVLKNSQDGSLGLAGSFYEPVSGRVMEVYTTMPGVQFYTGQGLDGSLVGKGENRYEKFAAFCFETEYYPDSPNQPDFPSAVLRPGEAYRHTTVYRFSTR